MLRPPLHLSKQVGLFHRHTEMLRHCGQQPDFVHRKLSRHFAVENHDAQDTGLSFYRKCREEMTLRNLHRFGLTDFGITWIGPDIFKDEGFTQLRNTPNHPLPQPEVTASFKMVW